MKYQEAHAYILNRLENELDPVYTYHSVDHTRDVVSMTEVLCRLESVGELDARLLVTAAHYHDAGFLISREEHEKAGCQIVRDTLPDFGYSNEHIERICGMIMATKIPQDPKDTCEMILSDADLDYLGRDDFYTIGKQLYHELYAFGVIKTWEEWNNLQIGFLSAHRYFTKTNLRRRRKEKLIRLRELENLVNQDS